MSYGLLADIGGTNARFWTINQETEEIIHQERLLIKDHKSFEDLINHYLDISKIKVNNAVFAVACPVMGDEIDFWKKKWKFSASKLQKELGLETLKIVNDFVAEAMAMPYLADDKLIKIGQANKPLNINKRAVLGLGTGLGAGYLIENSDGNWQAHGGEGSLVKASPTSHKESEIIKILSDDYKKPVIYEDVLSGYGLENIYNALSIMYNIKPATKTAEDISKDAIKEEDLALSSLNTMFEFFGTFASNYVCATGALGGVYISGGILKREGIREIFVKSKFREKFESAERTKTYLSKTPTFLILEEDPALLGLKNLLKGQKSTCNC